MKKKCINVLLVLVLSLCLGMAAFGAEPDGSGANSESDSSLSYLRVIPGELSPEFASDILEYSVTVEPNHTKLAISAKPTADTSKFVVSNTYLEVGTNIITIKVTAGDGSLTTYTLHVTRPEEGQNTAETESSEAETTPVPATSAAAGEPGKVAGIPVFAFFLLGMAIGGVILAVVIKSTMKRLKADEDDFDRIEEEPAGEEDIEEEVGEEEAMEDDPFEVLDLEDEDDPFEVLSLDTEEPEEPEAEPEPEDAFQILDLDEDIEETQAEEVSGAEEPKKKDDAFEFFDL